ncbi:MAG TPA: hypothetical protein VKY60_02135 [Burkholderiaceae bacterium]|nr:hypothetical protein [Burkholderiaceae bacterium]
MTTPDPTLVFTQEELDLIGHTADAMSAYMGKPVLAEIMDADDTGAEWVAFGIPLGVDDEVDEDSTVVIQLGGPGARFAGSRGGLGNDNDVYSCECLWIIQLSDDETARYVKVDPLNQEFVADNDLRELLPFNISDETFAMSSEDDDDLLGDDDDEEETRRMDGLLDDNLPPSRRLH